MRFTLLSGSLLLLPSGHWESILLRKNHKTDDAGFVRWALLALALGALLGGCVSADQDSDLPWNAAQPWETAPAGFSNLGSRL